MSFNPWTKSRIEGQEVITICTYCGAELFRGRAFTALESPEETDSKLGAAFKKHMTERHYDEAVEDLVKFWFAE